MWFEGASDVLVVDSTFLGNLTRVDNYATDPATSSLYVRDGEPELSEGQPQWFPDAGVHGTNCQGYDLSKYQTGPVGTGTVLALTNACLSSGDVELMRVKYQTFKARVRPFTNAFFQAALDEYDGPAWWRRMTVRAGACGDTGKPDPGRHFPCTP